MTHSIFSAFDTNPWSEVCFLLLDWTNWFEKVWHDVLLYILENNGIIDTLLDLI